jgi:hypothetical protein
MGVQEITPTALFPECDECDKCGNVKKNVRMVSFAHFHYRIFPTNSGLKEMQRRGSQIEIHVLLHFNVQFNL